MVLRGKNVEEPEEGGQKRSVEGGEGRHDDGHASGTLKCIQVCTQDTHVHLLVVMPVALSTVGIPGVHPMLSGVKWPRFKP